VTRHGNGAASAFTLVCLLVSAGLSACSDQQSPPDSVHPNTTVVVHLDKDLGPLNNPARYHNQTGPTAPLSASNLAMIEALHVRIVRVWGLPSGYYHSSDDGYNFDFAASDGTKAFDYLDQAVSYSRRLMMNLGECPQLIRSLQDPQRCRAALKAGIRAYKQRYPSLQYIELFNEPDRTWETVPNDPPGLSVDDYYEWYKIGYSIVNEVNNELRSRIPLRIGGPAAASFDEPYLQGFLDRYAADPDPAKRLDFLSYHQYAHRADPAQVAIEKPTVRGWLADRHLDTSTPVYVTEYGVFPGDSSGMTFSADLLTQAAAMATLSYYYVSSGMNMAMNWTFSHSSNDRKSMFASGANDLASPYFNMVKMQSMLRQRRVAADSDGLSSSGIGVNALATLDKTVAAVLITNYQWIDGKASDVVSLRMEDLPVAWHSGRLRVERYLVDANTSNYTHDPASSGLQRVQQYTVDGAASLDFTVPLGPNAMSLVVLTSLR
jgi:hypothetical protein